MPKDNEKIPLPDFGPLLPSEKKGFPADQMIGCETCMRSNPPTRVNCIYCGAILPVTEKSGRLQKPALRRLEKWEHGFNSIVIPARDRKLSPATLKEAGELIKLSVTDLERILSLNAPLPLARAATADEAGLISRRLDALGIVTVTVSDAQLNSSERVVRIRSASLDENGLRSWQISGASSDIPFSKIVLLVSGRVSIRRVEVKERKSRRAENDIVSTSEFFSDTTMLDIHTEDPGASRRIEAGNFDFSLLGDQKRLVAGENLNTLISLIRRYSPHAEFDDSFTSMRQALEPVWPSEQRNESIGWQRQRPGKYSTSGATESNNENQFTQYSRLRHYFKLNPLVHS